MSDNRLTKCAVLSFFIGLLVAIVGMVLLVVLESLYFIILSFIGIYFMTFFPVKLGKKYNYEVEDKLISMNRTLMQEFSYLFLKKKITIFPIDEYFYDQDINVNNGIIKFYNIYKKDDKIKIIYNNKILKVKTKKNVKKYYVKDFNNINQIIDQIKKSTN